MTGGLTGGHVTLILQIATAALGLAAVIVWKWLMPVLKQRRETREERFAAIVEVKVQAALMPIRGALQDNAAATARVAGQVEVLERQQTAMFTRLAEHMKIEDDWVNAHDRYHHDRQADYRGSVPTPNHQPEGEG